MAQLPKIFRANQGFAVVEFALLAPVLVLLIGGVVEYGRIFSVYKAVNRLATQYASAWADCYDSPTGACLTEISLYTSTYTIQNFAPQLTAANVVVSMFQVSMSGTTPTVVYAYPTGSSLTTAQKTALQTTLSSGQSGVIVTVSYTHTLLFFSKAMSSLLGGYLTPGFTAVQLKS